MDSIDSTVVNEYCTSCACESSAQKQKQQKEEEEEEEEETACSCRVESHRRRREKTERQMLLHLHHEEEWGEGTCLLLCTLFRHERRDEEERGSWPWQSRDEESRLELVGREESVERKDEETEAATPVSRLLPTPRQPSL